MRTRFFNAKVLDLSLADGYKNAEVWIDGKEITFVGENNKTDLIFDKEIDAKGNLLMPGFVNCHTHSAMTLLRGICDDISNEEWLFDYVLPTEKKLNPEDVYWGTRLANLEYLSSGITSVDEMYFFEDEVARAFADDGVRARVLSSYVGQNDEVNMKHFYNLLKIAKDNDLITVGTSIHSLSSTTEDNLDMATNFANKHGLPIGMHLCETLKEVGDCTVKNNGLTPPQYLERFGILDRKCTLYQCTNCDKDDLRLLKDYDANIIVCPSSNLKLANGIPPITTMVDVGFDIAIGTDDACSNNALNMFKEMYLVSMLSKVSVYDPTVIPAKKVIEMATKNGAKALGFNLVGEIKEGYKADLILVDIDKIVFQPNKNILSGLVYSAEKSNVYLTMIDGEVLYQNGRYLRANKNEIVGKCQEIVKRLYGKGE